MDNPVNQDLIPCQKWLFWMFFFIAWLLIGSGCISEKKISEERWDYHFDAMTLLERLSLNDTEYEDLFEPGMPPGMPNLINNPEVQWQIEDFFTVTPIVHQLAWGEGLDEWKLNTMSFHFACDPSGQLPFPYRSTFHYFLNDGNLRYESVIDIRSIDNWTWVEKTVYQPRIEEWSVMEIEKVIPVGKILSLAEERWGQQIRNEVNNLCDLGVSYYPINNNRDHPFWRVHYDSYDAEGEFLDPQVFFLDPFTGEEIESK